MPASIVDLEKEGETEKVESIQSLIIEGRALELFQEANALDSKDHKYTVVSSRDADVTLEFLEKYDSKVPIITSEQEKKLSRKVTWIIVSLTSFINLILYSDKATASYASILGLWEDIGLTQGQYLSLIHI